MTFFGIAAWIDMGDDRRKQLTVIGTLVAIDAGLAVGLGLAGWL